MKLLVPVVLATGALIAWLAPHAPGMSGGGTEGPKTVGTASALGGVAVKPAWYGGELVLNRAGDGHFYANVRIETRDYRMLVDTGASIVALTGDDARNIGLDWDPNDLAPVVQGAGGPVFGVPVMLKTVAVGDFEAHDVQAVIIPEGLPVSLLGQSFLSHVARVEISDDQLKLTN